VEDDALLNCSAFFFNAQQSWVDQQREVVMQSLVKYLILILLLGFTEIARADSDLLQKKNCFACHYMDKRKYGPNFKEISIKYANDSNAVVILAKKIKLGGGGVWGEDVMPPQPQVSDAEAQTIAKFVLSLK